MSQPPAPLVAASGVILDDAGRVLVVLRGVPPSEGRWTVPGGRVEAGETVRDAVRREVREETGLEVEVGELAWWLEHIDADHHYVILDFRADVVGGDLRAGDDARDARFMTRSELAAVPHTDGLLDYFDTHGVRLAP